MEMEMIPPPALVVETWERMLSHALLMIKVIMFTQNLSLPPALSSYTVHPT
jgi:hypothetical protein